MQSLLYAHPPLRARMTEIEIVYASHRPARMTDAEVVDGIVLPAMRFNRSVGITGCLWFGPGRFVQVLEGAAGEVEALYGRIQRDTRHSDVRPLRSGPIAARSFARWSMRALPGKAIDGVEAFFDAGRTPTPEAAAELRALMTTLAV